MALINIFTPKSPTLAGLEFDAVLEDTFEASVDLTGYPIELGARAVDHRIINPFRWSIVGAVSNTPLGPSVGDFIGGVLSNVTDNAVLGALAGLSAGFLAGSDETRSSSTLNALVSLMTHGEPFDIDAGDIQLKNMIISRIRRTKDPENEGGLIFEADLQEYPTLKTTLSKNQPASDELNPDDPSATQAAAVIDLGEISVLDTVKKTINDVNDVISETISDVNDAINETVGSF